jgi:hypothetical protein
MMPLHYVVSINQTKAEYDAGYNANRTENTHARARFFIGKNRNGPKNEVVTVRMNYMTMKAAEEDALQASQTQGQLQK